MATPAHRTCAVLSVGDELVLGQTLDTNSKWLSARLLELGVRVVEHRTVADDLGVQREAIATLASRMDLLIITGGLGPTEDDITRHALAAAAGDELIEDAAALEEIRNWFERAGRVMPDGNRAQALRPARGKCLSNDRGTAPGLALTITAGQNACDVYCLPGPPHEMQGMFESFIAPSIRPQAGRVVAARALHTFGMGESAIAGLLGDLMRRDRNPLVGTTASDGVVSCRIRFEGDADDATAQREVDSMATRLRDLLGDVVFGEGVDTLASVVLDALRKRGQSLATAESCTGGMIGQTLTAISGSSDVYAGGWITYANQMKSQEIGVDPALIEREGAVSRSVVLAMAEGALDAVGPSGSRVDHTIAVSGVAGPGASEAKPAGTVWIGLASRSAAPAARLFRFPGGRHTVRMRTTQVALALLRRRILGLADRDWLWEDLAGRG
ncbi:MAG: CinA family nicotinamide mononucleotide deamidase-related protein [Phycisphaerales bacterium]